MYKFCCCDFLNLLFLICLSRRSRRSLGGASQNFGKPLKVGVILECLLTWAHIPTPLKFGAKIVYFTGFCDNAGHKWQCFTVVVVEYQKYKTTPSKYDDYSVL